MYDTTPHASDSAMQRSATGLHPDVLHQLTRLRGRLPDDFAPRDDWTTDTPRGERRLPDPIQALLSIIWPEAHVLLDEDGIGTIDFPMMVEADEEDGPFGRAWLFIAYLSSQFSWIVDLDAVDDDPPIHVIDHDECDEEHFGQPTPLSRMLAELQAVPAPSPEDLFPRACAVGDVTAVREGMTQSPALGALNASGLTPLHLAVIGRSAEVVRLLVEAGADPDAALLHDHRIPWTYRHPQRHCPDFREVTAGTTPLHLALEPSCRIRAVPEIDATVIEALLTAGADPNAADTHGRTPLHAAVTSFGPDALAAVRLLLAAGADPHARMQAPSHMPCSAQGHTALTLAQTLGSPAAAALLDHAAHMS